LSTPHLSATKKYFKVKGAGSNFTKY